MRPAILALLIAAGLAAPALAQRAAFDFLKGAGLGNAEIEAMEAAETVLYSDPDAGAGTSTTWSTPAASGEATVTAREPRADGRPCIVIRHVAEANGASGPVTLPVKRCQAPDGRWLIAAQ